MTVYASYDPTSLIAGDFNLAARPVLLAMGQNASGIPLPKGSLLGQQATTTVSAVVKASGANTGNGTLTLDATTPILANAQPGLYTVRFTAPTIFRTYDPRGDVLGDDVLGTAFADQIKFGIAAGGTAFVVGDGFDILVGGTGKYVLSKANATDGSQVPACILTDDTDASAADVWTHGYFTGQFAFEIANIDTSWTITTLNQAFAARGQPMFFASVGASA